MLAIGIYFHRRWGYLVLKFFSIHEQAIIKVTKWDENYKPILVIKAVLATLE